MEIEIFLVNYLNLFPTVSLLNSCEDSIIIQDKKWECLRKEKERHMCTKTQLHQITSQMVQCYRDIYGTDVVGVFLYGSYARGDYDNESDIDMTAIVKGSRS